MLGCFKKSWRGFEVGFKALRSPALLKSLLVVGISASFSEAQIDFGEPDKDGWIRLWHGDNPGDFKTMYQNLQTKNFPDDVFTFQGDTIKVSGNPTGHVYHKSRFSHYRVRYQAHYPNNRQGNSGMLVHMQDKDPALFNQFPRSIECQGDPAQGMGQLWAISDVWVTVRARMGGNQPTYDPTANPIEYGGENVNKRVVAGIDGWAKPSLTQQMNDQWTTLEAEVHGSDSLMHFVNGKLMIRYEKPRVAPPNNPNQVEKYLTDGFIAWQSEGVPIWYRQMEIKLFPKDPLYDSLYKPVALGKSPYFESRPPVVMKKSAGTLSVQKGSRRMSLTGRIFPILNR